MLAFRIKFIHQETSFSAQNREEIDVTSCGNKYKRENVLDKCPNIRIITRDVPLPIFWDKKEPYHRQKMKSKRNSTPPTSKLSSRKIDCFWGITLLPYVELLILHGSWTAQAGPHGLQSSGQLGILLLDLQLCPGCLGVGDGVDDLGFGAG